MLSKEMREILVKAFNEIHDADKVAEIFNVSRRTVYTYVEKARAGESLEVRTSERGRKASQSSRSALPSDVGWRGRETRLYPAPLSFGPGTPSKPL